jgi:predicted AlkP superfamily phosphohydrolase/phosphomutase
MTTKSIIMELKRMQELAGINPDKYRVNFRDYYGNDIPYTEDYFTSEAEAEDWVNDHKSYSDDYDEVTYYNPQDQNKYEYYTIERF